MKIFKPNFTLEIQSLAVACGGAFGSLCRAGIEHALSSDIIAVGICNLLGTFTFSAAVAFRARPLSAVEKFVSVGFCGGFSIFATFSKNSVAFLRDGNYTAFALNGAANFILCVWAVYLAEATVLKFFPQRGNALENDMLKSEIRREKIAAETLQSAENGEKEKK